MKRIALITLHTPTATNHGGASALPYHLLAFRPQDIEVEVWSFNLNGCNNAQIAETETKLGLKVHVIKKPKWFRLLSPAPVRLFLPKPVLGYLPLPAFAFAEINKFMGDQQSAVWIYGEDIARIARRFNEKQTVITTPDCEAMYYYRVLGMKGISLNKMSLARYSLMYHRYAKFASQYPTGENITYHLVGEADAAFLKRLNPKANTIFIRHPHYDVTTTVKAEASGHEQIRLLIAGRYDFYMAQAANEAVEAMLTLPRAVKDKYKVTFLGKGWEPVCYALVKVGYKAQIKGFVEDYAAEVSSHHIQLTPVAIGTGTKGKVLDAFANGLMVVGTPLALENIAVESGRECIEYSGSAELAQWLCRLVQEPSLVNQIANVGQKAVLHWHGREKVANEFFSLFRFN